MSAAKVDFLAAPSMPADGPKRRDVLMVAASAYVGIGALASLWPLIQQMNPDATTLALATIEVDLSPVTVGQSITVMWRGKPVFIRHRTDAEIKEAQNVRVDQLIDRRSRVDGLPEDSPATDANRVKKNRDEWLIVVGICTHLGCVPQGQKLTDNRGQFGGWFCSCHGSQYDTSGRVRVGPAPKNLEVPEYHFLTDTRIEIGRLQTASPAA